MGLISVVGILVTLGLPILVVVLLTGALQRANEEDGPGEPGIGTVRRLVLYGLAFVALGLGASGVALLLGGMLDAVFDDQLVTASNTQIATALSLTVVGLPVWAILFLIAQRTARTRQVEHRSALRGVYFLLVRVIALAVLLTNAVGVAEMALGLEAFSGDAWGWLIVALAVWALHERLATPRTASAVARIMDSGVLAVGSVVGLYLLAAGVLALVIEPANAAYEALFQSQLVRSAPWTDDMTRALIWAVLGAVTWWWHWIARLRTFSTTSRSAPEPSMAPPMAWHIVVFIFGILAGVATFASAAGTLLYTALTWLLDATVEAGGTARGTGDAAEHFAGSVTAAAFALAGLAVWLYHHAVLRERIDPDAPPSNPEGIYRYLLAAAGLVALGSGVVTAIALAIDGLIPVTELVRGNDWWRDEVAVILTLVIVGGPLWWIAWSRAQRAVAGATAEEREALPRRAFIFLVFAVAALLAIGSLAFLLFEIFDSALAGEFGRETVRGSRWSVAILAAAGAIAGYYWLVLREDQAALREAIPEQAPGEPRAVRAVTIVGPALAGDTAARRLRRLGIAVRLVRRLDVAPDVVPMDFERELDGLTEVLLRYRAPEALVLIGADGVEVTPITSDSSGA